MQSQSNTGDFPSATQYAVVDAHQGLIHGGGVDGRQEPQDSQALLRDLSRTLVRGTQVAAQLV